MSFIAGLAAEEPIDIGSRRQLFASGERRSSLARRAFASFRSDTKYGRSISIQLTRDPAVGPPR